MTIEYNLRHPGLNPGDDVGRLSLDAFETSIQLSFVHIQASG